MESGQWVESSDGQRWYFDPGSLALDFAYTGDFGTGHTRWEQWHEVSDLDDWIRPRFGPVTAASTKTFEQAKALREAVCTLAVARADGTDAPAYAIDVVNRAAAQRPIRPFLPGGSLDAGRVRVSQVLSTVAADAIDLCFSAEGRVRRCAASDCRLIFVDLSRPNSRRWCSMSRCGNRSKLRTRRSTSPTTARR